MQKHNGAYSPHERGVADCYFRSRFGPTPHYCLPGGEKVTEERMTPEQIAEYRRGWDEQEADGDKWEDEGDF